MIEHRPLRILIADDHPFVLAGIKAFLTGAPEVEIVGEASDGETALKMAVELQPSILVLDLSMPGLNGVEVTKRLSAELPSCKVVILTVHEDRSYLRKLIEVGAAGYVLKRSAGEDLLRAIKAVAAGGVYLDPAIAALAINQLSSNANDAPEFARRFERARSGGAALDGGGTQQQSDRRHIRYRREEHRNL